MSANVFELQGSITMDTSGFDKAIKDVISEGKNLVKALTENTTQMKALQDSVSKMQAQLDSAAKAMKDTADATATMAKEADKSADATDDMKKEINDLKNGLEKTNKAVEDTVDETKKLADRMDKAESEAADLKTEVDRLGKEYDDTEKDTKDLEDETKKLGNTADNTAEKFKNFAEFLKNGFVIAAKTAVATFTAAGAAVAGYTKSAFGAYSQYEQNAGAIQAMFGEDAAATVFENAENAAFKANTSINDYLNGFIELGQLISNATGRGEQTDIDALKEELDAKYDAQKEYWDRVIKYADSAEKDMLRSQKNADLKQLKQKNKTLIEEAEMANKSSTITEESLAETAKLYDVVNQDIADLVNRNAGDADRILAAYKKMAAGEYTMLDNLKLGYDQTKAGMEQLLNDAERLTGLEYDIDNFADVINAIHEIIKYKGIAGATEDEGTTTIEGSAKAFKAVWDNLKLYIAEGDIPKIEQAIDDLMTSMQAAIDNAVPVIERILTNIGVAVPKIAKAISEKLPGLVRDLLPSLIESVTQLIAGVVGAIPDIFNAFTDKTMINNILISFEEMWAAVWNALSTLLTSASGVIPDLLDQLGNALIKSTDDLAGPLKQMAYAIGTLLKKTLPVLVPIIIGLLDSIGNVIFEVIPALLPELSKAISALLDSISGDDLMQIADITVKILDALFSAIAEAGEDLSFVILPFIARIIEEVLAAVDENEEYKQALGTMLVHLVEAAFFVLLDTIEILAGTLVAFLLTSLGVIYEEVFEPAGTKLGEWLQGLHEDFINGVIEWKDETVEKIEDMIYTIGDAFGMMISDAKQWGADLIQSFIDGITDKNAVLGYAMGDVAGNISKYIHFSEPDEGPLSDFHTYGPDMMQLLAQGIKDNASLVYDQINALATGISSDLSVDTISEAPLTAANGTVNNYSVNISFDGATISENTDLDNLSDTLIEKISEGLAMLDVFQTRAYGGVTI